ncbi:hypothetical protein BWD12_02930 [Leptospira santarosai serovar Bananal]|nr:hypothetical protein B2G51_16790 [Leptospira santarosai]ONF81110.1 hypothetical protein BWD12_02930 [Leptospira santarosai serovar Bananal]
MNLRTKSPLRNEIFDNLLKNLTGASKILLQTEIGLKMNGTYSVKMTNMQQFSVISGFYRGPL